jgi:hypothetical protein
MKSAYWYVGLSALFAVSVVGVVWLPGEFAKVLGTLSGAAAVFAGIFQLFRDELEHDRARALEASRQSFALGATSHMATVAFDRHVAFSEAYAAEVFETLTTLFREGPSEGVFPHVRALHEIRSRWAVWLTPAIDRRLGAFEGALRRIAANARFVVVDVADPKRQEAIEEMYALFAEITGMKEWAGRPVPAGRDMETIVHDLRQMLGIDQLTTLRQTLVARSLKDAG